MRHLILQALITAIISFGAGYVLAPHALEAETVNQYIVSKPEDNAKTRTKLLAKLTHIAEYDADRFDMDHLREIGAEALMCPSPATKEIAGLCSKLIRVEGTQRVVSFAKPLSEREMAPYEACWTVPGDSRFYCSEATK